MSRYKQGIFKPLNPKKYLGDDKKIIYRSGWERKLMFKLDQSSSVIGWVSEEIVIPYISPLDNRPHRYFMDFLVVTRDRKCMLIEVKPFAQTQLPKKGRKTEERYSKEVMTYLVNQAKWDATEIYCKKRGWAFKICTEKDLNFI